MILPPIFAAVFLVCTGSAWVFSFVTMWYTAILIEKVVMSKVRNIYTSGKTLSMAMRLDSKLNQFQQEARNEVDR